MSVNNYYIYRVKKLTESCYFFCSLSFSCQTSQWLPWLSITIHGKKQEAEPV